MPKILRIGFTLFLVTAATVLHAQQYRPDGQSSTVKFKVSHQMIFKSTVTGTFNGLNGGIYFDPKNLSKSVFDVSIQAETINSGIGMRDNHLKDAEYFDAVKYRSITIKAQNIAKGTSNNGFIFSGTLTMKGITKTISFPFNAKPANGGYEFSGSFELNRLEYNVGPDNSIDKNVEVILDVFAR
jgi:polyisoprenoid-binding protein YceI